MTRDPRLNALILRERLASDYRAALAGNRSGVATILAALRAAAARCLTGEAAE